MEHTSELVKLGKILNDSAYNRKLKGVRIGNMQIDFLGDSCKVHEVKKAKTPLKSHEYQVLFYLYQLKKIGIDAKGVINYPLIRKNISVRLTESNKIELLKTVDKAEKMLSNSEPPNAVKIPFCKSCSYYNFCWC